MASTDTLIEGGRQRCPSMEDPWMAMLTPEITATFTYKDDQGLSMAAPDNPLFAQLNMACRKWHLEQSHMSQNLELENCADFHLRGQYSIP